MTEETRRLLWAALREKDKWTHEQRWQEMIDRGFIDAQGNVLLPARAPMPWTPEPKPQPPAEEGG